MKPYASKELITLCNFLCELNKHKSLEPLLNLQKK